jgi:predicted 3-demethylubiquinone-9 3-methyltransferase (glyoxalase superfamily)
VVIELLSDPDTAKSQQVMKAMLQMGKIDIEQLQRASLQKA